MGIYIINGFPGAGKDLFCSKVEKIVTPSYFLNISTVDIVKQVAKSVGWNGEKTSKAREFLSDLKLTLKKWDNIPFKDVVKKTNLFLQGLERYGINSTEAAVFIMCREPNEIAQLKEKLNAKTIIIRRKAAEEKIQSNLSDSMVLAYAYDIEIDNNGSFQDIAFAALNFVDKENLHFDSSKTLKIDSEGNIEYN